MNQERHERAGAPIVAARWETRRGQRSPPNKSCHGLVRLGEGRHARYTAPRERSKDMESYTADDPERVRPPYDDRLTGGAYFAAGVLPGVSLGVMPRILMPAPRAMSIASITAAYFTPGTPLTNMIFSLRGAKMS
jgi:hypothetical protein